MSKLVYFEKWTYANEESLKDLKECDINARKAVKYLIEGRINEN